MTLVSEKGELVNILITAGGTREDIDPVRGITNYATGRLGRLIADLFLKSGDSVTYICAETSERPSTCTQFLDTIIVRNTAQLKEQFESALLRRPYDAVIHSMAVSDYAPCNTASKKISSDSPFLVVVLERQPKVIKLAKEIQPDAILVGFKLLSSANEEELLQAARKQILKYHSDYVLANSQDDIKGNSHKAMLIGRDGIVARGNTKEEIAGQIYRQIYKGVRTSYENNITRDHRQYCSV